VIACSPLQIQASRESIQIKFRKTLLAERDVNILTKEEPEGGFSQSTGSDASAFRVDECACAAEVGFLVISNDGRRHLLVEAEKHGSRYDLVWSERVVQDGDQKLHTSFMVLFSNRRIIARSPTEVVSGDGRDGVQQQIGSRSELGYDYAEVAARITDIE
jgi:hypothetical protein